MRENLAVLQFCIFQWLKKIDGSCKAQTPRREKDIPSNKFRPASNETAMSAWTWAHYQSARTLWSRRSGLNGTTCHRFGPETCLTDSYKGGQPPCTIPTKGAHPLRAPQVARSTNRNAHPTVLWSLFCVTYGAGDPD